MLGWYRAMRQELVRRRRYGRVEAKTLLIWGMADPAFNYDDVVPGTENLVPRFEVHRIQDCGHFVQSERPEEVNAALLKFLGESP
jgi:pimeloyl-ACP methyl ester carboxylesterase